MKITKIRRVTSDLVHGQAEVVIAAPGPGRTPAEAGLLRLAGAEREAGGGHHGAGGLVLALHTVPVSAVIMLRLRRVIRGRWYLSHTLSWVMHWPRLHRKPSHWSGSSVLVSSLWKTKR